MLWGRWPVWLQADLSLHPPPSSFLALQAPLRVSESPARSFFLSHPQPSERPARQAGPRHPLSAPTSPTASTTLQGNVEDVFSSVLKVSAPEKNSSNFLSLYVCIYL